MYGRGPVSAVGWLSSVMEEMALVGPRTAGVPSPQPSGKRMSLLPRIPHVLQPGLCSDGRKLPWVKPARTAV